MIFPDDFNYNGGNLKTVILFLVFHERDSKAKPNPVKVM